MKKFLIAAILAVFTGVPALAGNLISQGLDDPEVTPPPGVVIEPRERLICGTRFIEVRRWWWMNTRTDEIVHWTRLRSSADCDRDDPPGNPPNPPECKTNCEPPQPPECKRGCDPEPPKPPKPPKDHPKGNNGWGNGDQDAPGNSGDHNNAENGPKGDHDGRGKDSGNSGKGRGKGHR